MAFRTAQCTCSSNKINPINRILSRWQWWAGAAPKDRLEDTDHLPHEDRGGQWSASCAAQHADTRQEEDEDDTKQETGHQEEKCLCIAYGDQLHIHML